MWLTNPRNSFIDNADLFDMAYVFACSQDNLSQDVPYCFSMALLKTGHVAARCTNKNWHCTYIQHDLLLVST